MGFTVPWGLGLFRVYEGMEHLVQPESDPGKVPGNPGHLSRVTYKLSPGFSLGFQVKVQGL